MEEGNNNGSVVAKDRKELHFHKLILTSKEEVVFYEYNILRF